MEAKKMVGKVIYKENLAGKTWLIGIEFLHEVMFTPGQFVSLKVSDEGLRRSYSIASLPGKKFIELVVNVAPMGIGSKYILGIKIGDSVEVLGFLGKFVVRFDELTPEKRLIFIGTGAGIVPLKPMIENLLINNKFNGKINLIWGMRYETDLYWITELDKLQREYDNFCMEIALSHPGERWPGVQGHVGDVIDKISIEEKDTIAFLCGNPEMITEISDLLKNKGVPSSQILYERFA